MMYDEREKAQRDQQWLLEGTRQEALQEGEEKGLEKGKVIGTISTLQDILGEPVTAEDELKKLDEAELNSLCSDLQERLRTRGC